MNRTIKSALNRVILPFYKSWKKNQNYVVGEDGQRDMRVFDIYERGKNLLIEDLETGDKYRVERVLEFNKGKFGNDFNRYELSILNYGRMVLETKDPQIIDGLEKLLE